MTPERWEQVGQLYQAALELRPGERTAFVRHACGEDESLYREVESLLAADRDAADFLSAGAIEDAAKLVAEENSFSPGKQLGHYQVRSLLGAGGMGEVYLAQDTKLDRAVALKILSAEFAADKDRMRRFKQEARSAAALNHANIAHIYEIGEAEGKHYISMEYIEGETLRNAIHREKSSLPNLLKYLAQVAAGLAKAHEKGIVHRDLKPDNIMITRDGDAKILDFGLAKLVEPTKPASSDGIPSQVTTARISQHSTPGMVMGTVGYMSPEQAQGKVREIDHRSDIFSFGCILYEAATGQRAFEGKDVLDSLHKIVYAPTPQIKDINPTAPDELQRIVRRCLAKEPEKRYQSIKDLGIELEELRQELKTLPEFDRADGRAVSLNAQTKTEGAYPSAIGTAENGASRPTSSAEYVVSEISRHKRVAVAVMLVVVAGIAVGGSYYFRAQKSQVAVHSIAVLPFTNVSKDAEMDYLSDGISESLINSLSQLPGVKVIARSSAFKYKGTEVDLKEVAQALGVDAILTGRVTQRGDNLSISVELVNASDKTQMWGHQYNRKPTDLLQVQAEISREIAESLRLRLSADQQRQLAGRSIVEPVAYEMLLKGRFYWNKGGDDDRKKAIDYYQKAIAIDPNYALAYAELANAYSILGNDGVIDPQEAVRKAEESATKALELDGELAEAHKALAYNKQLAWDWAEAEREYKRAIELNPNYADAHASYSTFLSLLGRREQAIGEAKRAKELDPISVLINIGVFVTLFNCREYEQALDVLKQMHELDPNHPLTHIYSGYTYSAMGRYPEAIAAYKERPGDMDVSGQIYLGYAYAKAGQREEAQAILSELQKTKQYVSPAELAILYVGLGEKDQAFLSLERAYEAHDVQLQYLNADPHFDSLRSDPRFANLVRRMRFPQ
jgi:serine/threonine protein kinase/Tfp pilus assembly protein PilF